jgi:hypothetical protein
MPAALSSRLALTTSPERSDGHNGTRSYYKFAPPQTSDGAHAAWTEAMRPCARSALAAWL